MNPAKVGFLDTDIHIFLCHPEDALRNAARDAANIYQIVGSSSYSRLEFKRNHLRDMAYLWNKLGKHTESEVEIKLSKLGYRHQRKLGRVLAALARITKKIESRGIAQTPEERRATMRLHLENFIEWDWDAFEARLDFLHKGTGCGRAEEPPFVGAAGRLEVTVRQCRGAAAPCRINKFFDENRKDFEKVESAIAKLEGTEPEKVTNELKAFRVQIIDASKDSSHLCDDRICAKLGDVLIAIDAKTGDPKPCPELLSSNAAEHVILSKALDTQYNHFKKPPS